MGLAERLVEVFESLPEEKKMEVIDFVEYLNTKNQKDLESLMDAVISENRTALEELSK